MKMSKAGLLNVLCQLNSLGEWERMAGIANRGAFWEHYKLNQDAGFIEIERRAVRNFDAIRSGHASIVWKTNET